MTGEASPIHTPCVVMIGTSLHTMGGISAVVNGYRRAGLFRKVSIVYVTTHADGSHLHKLGLAGSAYLRLLYLLMQRSPHLFHIHLSSRASFWRKLPMVLLIRLWRRPYLIHLHGSEFSVFYDDECGPIRRSLIASVFDHADFVLALSPEWRDFVARISSNRRILVFTNAVEVADVPPQRSVDIDRLTIAFLGRLGQRKGIYDLLKALSSIHDEFPRFTLVAAGDGEIEKVRREAEALGLSDHVETPGWLDEAGKQALLRRAAVFALPSHAEGLPMSLLEAMASAVAIVCSNAGGIPVAIEPDVNGLMVEAGDITQLTSALKRLLRSADLRTELGFQAFRRARRDFNVGDRVEELVAMYKEYGVTST